MKLHLQIIFVDNKLTFTLSNCKNRYHWSLIQYSPIKTNVRNNEFICNLARFDFLHFDWIKPTMDGNSNMAKMDAEACLCSLENRLYRDIVSYLMRITIMIYFNINNSTRIQAVRPMYCEMLVFQVYISYVNK